MFDGSDCASVLGLRRHLAAPGAAASEAENTARKYMENATGEFGAAGRSPRALLLVMGARAAHRNRSRQSVRRPPWSGGENQNRRPICVPNGTPNPGNSW